MSTMEVFRRNKNRSNSMVSHTGRGSAGLSASSAPASLTGNRKLPKQGSSRNLAFDSSSSGSNITEEVLVTFDLDQRSLKESRGTPMKKLLSLEMSKEKESKRGSPSVIAKLMGLDALPPQQAECKWLKMKEDSSQMKSHKSSASSSRKTSRKISNDGQEFKDVYEVFDAARTNSFANTLHGTSNRKSAFADMALIRKKFMDIKHLSADEKFWDSKELDDALEVLDSNADLFLKFLEQPDFLFTKHLHDLRGTPPQLHCRHMLAVNASHTLNYKNSCRDQRLDSQILHKNHPKCSRKHKEFASSDSDDKCTVHGSLKLSKFPFEEKNEPAVEPTRIVVLKPNLGKSRNVARTASSPHSSHPFSSDCRKAAESMGVNSQDAKTCDIKEVTNEFWFSRHNSKESREIAKEITRQIRNSFKTGPTKFSNSSFRGYAGDESSCEISTGDSANDSDILTATSTETFKQDDRLRLSSPCSTESFVSREAKKRLSERWKLTHRPQNMSNISKGNTLGEMLAISDREVMLEDPNGNGECSSRSLHKYGGKVQNEPLGISSRDGWKDECLSNLSRSRSLPASATDLGSPKTSMQLEIFGGDKCVTPKEDKKMEKNKAVKGNFIEREYSFSRKLRSSSKEAHYHSSNVNKNSNALPESLTVTYEVKRNFERDEQSEENPSVVEPSACTTTDIDSGPENTASDNGQNRTALSEPSDVELSAIGSRNGTSCIVDADATSYQGLSDGRGPSVNEVSPHLPASGLGSQTTLKEADQPSPVSILEAPFGDDLSLGSECFESLSADIHGLRMQLKLLKLESEVYEGGQMMVSSDEDDEQSVELQEDKAMLTSKDSWESLYLADVLNNAGISDADPDTFMSTCYSADYPMNPKVFEELEKKYCDQLRSWSRSERKLMFDSVNSKLVEIHKEFTNQQPWLKSAARFVPKWNKQAFKDSLHKVASSNNKKANKDGGEEVLARELKWSDLREEIDGIGREIENMLIDELIAEVKL